MGGGENPAGFTLPAFTLPGKLKGIFHLKILFTLMGHTMGGGSTASTRGNGLPLERADTLATLLASVNDLVWCTSVDGSELLYVNSAAERIYVRPLDELVKNPELWLEAIHPDDRDAVTANLSKILEERKIEQEYRIIRPDGETR
jgi:PAS domain S-box-containing protein